MDTHGNDRQEGSWFGPGLAGQSVGGAESAGAVTGAEPLVSAVGGARSSTGSDDLESDRLAAVRRYDILDTPPDGAFDRVAALAARWLDCPVATVTIVDEERIWFKSVRGLDGVTQIDREPGLCASAVLDDGVYVVTDALMDPRARHNGLVTGPVGLRFYAAAPITTADGFRLGTINVIDTRPRELGDAERLTLLDLAAVVMDELELRLSAMTTLRLERALRQQAERDHDDLEVFAATLQRSLLPPSLPRVPGLQVASYYRTASPRLVGGDFYDVFGLGGGRWALVIGDVCGKGAPAAALTSLARHTIRAAAIHDPDPVAVLAELNQALLNDPSKDSRFRFCSVIFGVVEPRPEHPDAPFRLTLGTGGHPPALLLRSDGTVESLRTPGGIVTGVVEAPQFTTCSTDLRPGDALLLYTDGWTETRNAQGDLFGEDGVRAFLQPLAGASAARLVERAESLLDQICQSPTDDVAILAVAVPRPSATTEADQQSQSPSSAGRP